MATGLSLPACGRLHINQVVGCGIGWWVEFSKSLPANIVVMDGQMLAKVLIDHGVGVIDEETYRVKRVEREYFGECTRISPPIL